MIRGVIEELCKHESMIHVASIIIEMKISKISQFKYTIHGIYWNINYIIHKNAPTQGHSKHNDPNNLTFNPLLQCVKCGKFDHYDYFNHNN